MNETYMVKVHRREGRLWVGAYVLSMVAFEAVDDLFPAEMNSEELTRSLIRADERAHRELALPRGERCHDKKGFWLAAGCRTWRMFARGLTSCDIVREANETSVGYWVPNPKRPANMRPTDFERHYPADISYEELAPIVLRVFATFPPDMKVPVR